MARAVRISLAERREILSPEGRKHLAFVGSVDRSRRRIDLAFRFLHEASSIWSLRFVGGWSRAEGAREHVGLCILLSRRILCFLFLLSLFQ